MTAMQFDTFVWPHNPKTYTVRYLRRLVRHPMPYAAEQLEDQGCSLRVMEGEGEFFGPQAYETFARLADCFSKRMPGLLLHPLWQSCRAYFDSLVLMEEPKENYVRYAFRFVEAPPYEQLSYEQTPDTVLLTAGQSLWSLAQTYGRSTRQLLASNPQLATCNDARPGQELRL